MISASPIPINTCVPTIAPSTVVTENVAVAPIAYWIVNPTAAAGTDKRSGQVIGEIIQMIRDTGIDPSDVLEEVGQEFGIAFEFGRGQ